CGLPRKPPTERPRRTRRRLHRSCRKRRNQRARPGRKGDRCAPSDTPPANTAVIPSGKFWTGTFFRQTHRTRRFAFRISTQAEIGQRPARLERMVTQWPHLYPRSRGRRRLRKSEWPKTVGTAATRIVYRWSIPRIVNGGTAQSFRLDEKRLWNF